MYMPDSVLLIDDEKHIRFYISLLLKNIGIPAVYEATNGEEGIESFKTNKPDFVMLDINMPGDSGIEVLKKIMEIDEDAIVVMLTAVNSMHIVEDCAKIGATNYILKDTPEDVLSNNIREIISECFED